jgi:integrase
MKDQTDTESLWTKAPVANMVRYEPSGIYFARAKVRGKLIRQSLKTNVLSVAKQRLADLLDAEHRAVAPSEAKVLRKMTFGGALAIFRERQKHDVELKAGTKKYNEELIAALLRTWPDLASTDIKKITKHDCLCWRSEFGERYSSTRVNGALSILRRVFDIAIETGVRYDNPAKSKEVKRARVRRKELRLPEPDQFLALVNQVRTAGGGFSKDCADAIEFFAYAGPRLSEAARIHGSDCNFAKGEIIIRGDPETGTKNWGIRRVPMIPEMRRLLERLRAERGADRFFHTPVLAVRKFKRALLRACRNLGLARLTHHDMRHLFATRCIERGVDIPTVAKWLGHKDGGVLAMQTYGHLRDQHSGEMAQKVVFFEAKSSPERGTHNEAASKSDSHKIMARPNDVAKAKAKYRYPWWASPNPLEVFWGQLNEPVRIVAADHLHACSEQAMGRKVFELELHDCQSLTEEFLARASKTELEALLAKFSPDNCENKCAAGTRVCDDSSG